MECSDLPRMDVMSKSDPFIVAYEMNSAKEWIELGRTEVIVNSQAFLLLSCLKSSPAFVKKIFLTYKFEEIQKLRFVVYDADTEGDSSLVIALHWC